MVLYLGHMKRGDAGRMGSGIVA